MTIANLPTPNGVTTKWLNAMTAPKPRVGHKLTYDRNGGGWCQCGRYCGGLSCADYKYPESETRAETRQAIRTKHHLHLVREYHARQPC